MKAVPILLLGLLLTACERPVLSCAGQPCVSHYPAGYYQSRGYHSEPTWHGNRHAQQYHCHRRADSTFYCHNHSP